MDRLGNAILDKLKKGSIKTVVLFSDFSLDDETAIPETPYVIIKPENGNTDNTRQYRIIVHHDKGQLDVLEDYVLKELNDLLLEELTDTDGARHKLYRDGYTDINANPFDDTYFMEGIFFSPMLMR